MHNVQAIFHQGLWKNNPALTQLIGLCPVLAVSSTAINALALGLATTLVLTGTNTLISLCRRWIAFEIRIPIYVMIIACMVSILQMLMQAFAFEMYQSLGIFIPLIITNCIVIGRAEVCAVKSPPALAALDGLAMGLGISAALFILGALREILGQGTLFDGADRLPGHLADTLRIEIIHYDNPFLLAILPAGAFIGLGMMLAIKSLIDEKITARHRKTQPAGTATTLQHQAGIMMNDE